MLDKTSEGFTAMIEGGTDTEHFAALYFTYLCDPPDLHGADKHYEASLMWEALQSTVHTVEKIQKDRGMVDVDNYLNICTSMCSSSFCSQSTDDRSRWREPSWALLPLQAWA
jgi:glutamine amidotransferase